MKGHAKCIVCEKALREAPTTDGWIRVRYAEGVCWDCVESLHRHVEAVKRAIKEKWACPDFNPVVPPEPDSSKQEQGR